MTSLDTVDTLAARFELASEDMALAIQDHLDARAAGDLRAAMAAAKRYAEAQSRRLRLGREMDRVAARRED